MPDNNQYDDHGGAHLPQGRGSRAAKKKTAKKKAAKIIVSLVVVAAVAVAAYFLLKPEPEGNDLVIGDYEDIENLRKKAEDGYITVAMDMTWYIPNPAEPFEVRVMNSNDNSKNFFIEVSLKDSGDVVYTSDVVPVGKEIREMTLEKTDLAPGEYAATCAYNILNDEGEVYDYAYFEIELVVG